MFLDIMTTKLFVETKQNQGLNGHDDIYAHWIDCCHPIAINCFEFTPSHIGWQILVLNCSTSYLTI